MKCRQLDIIQVKLSYILQTIYRYIDFLMLKFEVLKKSKTEKRV
tara:strand:+ start:320 stop:451 length:132 start_codon:yes stop_codon:yes gene_type:complete